ncbi:type II 3-dehydroquinate dehydratase [Halobacillus salinarum]|uniref:3-dehydroquinate dehydratase n=1 Tax=Halobacillus salinarum TaxID=2932257 RepID=A0ABY4EDN2_9BACI|nr:type II 3-dehydroquinate dehydratase [Halobacillus salinarum]UOQ42550.1 type II 3-dehydroquinate dehydratase [Halobacillus salinarum]
MKRLLLLNGPNLNLLGQREPETYGSETLQKIIELVNETAAEAGYELDHFQSNHEGELIDKLQQSQNNVSGIIFNPAAYTHTSIAIRDAVSAIDVPVIEVHISNVHKREAFRHHSMIAPVSAGQIVGFGIEGYRMAAHGLLNMIEKEGR